MRIPPPDHGEVLSGIELDGKPHALGMSYDPVEKFSSRTRQADYFARCPIELRNAQRLGVIPGEVVEAVEHGKLPPSVLVVWGRVHVSAADVHPLPSWPVVPPVGFCCSACRGCQDAPHEQQVVVASHALRATKCGLPHGPQIAIYVTTPKDGRPSPPSLKGGQLNSCNILTGTTWPVLSVQDFRCCATFITYSSESMPAAVGAPLHRSR